MSLPSNKLRGNGVGREGGANYQNKSDLCQVRGVIFWYSQGESFKLILRLLVNHLSVTIHKLWKLHSMRKLSCKPSFMSLWCNDKNLGISKLSFWTFFQIKIIRLKTSYIQVSQIYMINLHFCCSCDFISGSQIL